MRKRTQKSGKTYYYYDTGGKPRKEIPLSGDYVFAVQRWAVLEGENASSIPVHTFRQAAERYLRDILPSKAVLTQKGNLKELEFLYRFFDDPPAPLDEIEPQHVRQYRSWRIAQTRARLAAQGRPAPADAGAIRANRELALFSHVFNYARETGMTAAPNPSAGVRKSRERGRDIYVEDELYLAVYAAADQPLRDAMDMIYLTGQRPADVLALEACDIKDGTLALQQGKTGHKLRIEISGELAALIDRIRIRRASYSVASTALILNESGHRLSAEAMRSRFDKARAKAGIAKDRFQLRDLRAKAGTDKTEAAGDIRQAQKQLGHRSVAMTEHYVRNRLGDKVMPTK